MKRVVGLGACVLDTIISCESYPREDNKSDEQVNVTFAAMQQQMDKYGITVWSIHLPYEDKNWTSISASESIRKQSVEYILRALRLCAANFPTCKNYVLHASKSVSPSATAISQAHKSLMEMDEVAKQLGVRFCVENLVGSFCYTIDDLMAVIKPFDNVYATFDIGHANCKGYDVVEYLKAIGTKLGTVHIHDTAYKSGSDDHRLVGDGDIATKTAHGARFTRLCLQITAIAACLCLSQRITRRRQMWLQDITILSLNPTRS